MQSIETIRKADAALAAAIESQGGVLNVVQLEAVAKIDRMIRVVVRCGCGRFYASADQAPHFIRIVTEHGEDYVRDVSLLVAI